ncbi:putative bifunctional diguanylate cyclase/phosphodiesterase [Actinomycetospora cinnamomea]|uniref:Diguanylate cyclase/phosphodiesterase with PAS/PAC sensor(S) n=1 Tax=Actinomycetospora cinnamomea TaxID=663609 RepID=A0A2U1ECM8_9PSEU|nr:EAL domain-containing protein [Actinomycetospora cinnamomea]PVY97723.1 diguanylate cyclase/phosphodiesterase with PAS/PAC sensor(s) [Actinomycetospora cinnamomea]
MTEPGRASGADPLDALAADWAEEVEGTSYVPMAAEELRAHLRDLARLVVDAVQADPPRPEVGAEIGRRLVAAHFTGPATLERTVVLLSERLPALYGPGLRETVPALTGALAAGYAETLRDRTLGEQEAIRRAVLAARQHTENALHASEARFRAMFREAAIGIGLGDMEGRILEVNPALCRMFGYTPEEFTQRSVVQQMHPDDAPSVWERYERMIHGDLENFRVEKRFYRADGSSMVVHLTLSLVRDERGEPAYQVAMLEDVSERHRLQEHLAFLAYHDPLTTLANRARITERLGKVFAEAGGSSTRRVGVCFLDLDGFKTINDSLGHHVGDLMLQEVARRLDACAGEGELVARMGGDEFVVLVEDSHGVDRLVALADRILAVLASPFHLVGQELVVTASIGVVEQAVAETTASELMRAADITLYTAKAEGRGRWAVHDPGRDETETTRFSLSAALPSAVAHDEFFVLYQPLVSLADHRVRGVEALVRWRHPRLGVLSPSLFIGPAEETGVIVPLGRRVLETACRDARGWHAEFGAGAPFVSVNVAPRQLHEPGLVAEVAALLDTTGLPADRLQVELTERALTIDEGAPLKALDGLRAMGVKIAVDDFGTGYSNLSYLRKLPVDVIKLDGSFGEGLREEELSDEVDERIVGTLVALGHALDLTVTAEGVETAAQASRLRALGCDEGQGWLFAPAVPAGEVAALLRRGRPLGGPATGLRRSG